MRNREFQQLFIDQLEDIYDAENQIIQELPKLIQLASNQELKDALNQHLKETQNQAKRLQKIFSVLNIKPMQQQGCEAMKGILQEGQKMTGQKSRSPLLDATIIAAAQKVEHYEIASYGTLRALAKHLELENEIINALQESLDEEGSADKLLTKLAEGNLLNFFEGINKQAAEESTASGYSGYRK